jgi:hypothetical protein
MTSILFVLTQQSERFARSGTKTSSGSDLTFMVSSTNVEEFILSMMADT